MLNYRGWGCLNQDFQDEQDEQDGGRLGGLAHFPNNRK